MTALIALLVVVLGFVACCLVDVARAREFRRLDRETWALICLVSLPLGGILYLSAGKKWKVRDPGSVPRRASGELARTREIPGASVDLAGCGQHPG